MKSSDECRVMSDELKIVSSYSSFCTLHSSLALLIPHPFYVRILLIMATLAVNKLSLAPLGAGDLIDRAVRLYRRHFMTLIRISTPPVVVSVIGAVIMTISMREVSRTPDEVWFATHLVITFLGFL